MSNRIADNPTVTAETVPAAVYEVTLRIFLSGLRERGRRNGDAQGDAKRVLSVHGLVVWRLDRFWAGAGARRASGMPKIVEKVRISYFRTGGSDGRL